MRFLIDAQLPPALARWLSAEGHESIHVMDMEMQASSDRVIWDFAVQSNFIIVTKDEDFAQRKIMAKKGPCVLWLRWPNSRRSDVIDRFAVVLPAVIAGLERGETLIEVR